MVYAADDIVDVAARDAQRQLVQERHTILFKSKSDALIMCHQRKRVVPNEDCQSRYFSSTGSTAVLISSGSI
jgi:adenosylmethionine-8-amino-7-oxononanoate aminotransferase